jgi:chemotaxis protein methyltransferase CheR
MSAQPIVAGTLEDLEMDLLLEGISREYGCDFRGYARSSLKRRVLNQMRAEGLRTVSGFQERVLHDAPAMGRLLVTLATNVSAMFRDPGFYLTFRRDIVPLLRTYPFVRIWHAGCSTGEEAYSMAILLQEEQLYPRVRIYATDMSESVLARAKLGAYPVDLVRGYEALYQKGGGRRALSDYYTVQRDTATFSAALRENIVFGQHNLATDRSFNEFNVVLCRNVMIHFDKDLQRQVHGLLYESLCRLGILGLGARESLRWSGQESNYEVLDADNRIYRRVY